MKNPELVTAKKKIYLEHFRSLKNANETDHNAKARYKKLIKNTKGSFLRKALSSKKPNEVWDAVNRIINPPKSRVRQRPVI